MIGARSRMLPTLLAMAAALVAGWMILPSLVAVKPQDEQKIVTISVVFSPTTRRCTGADGRRDLAAAVAVVLKVGGDTYPLERVCKSPWVRTVYPKRYEVIHVTAEQKYGVDLSCRIIQLGVPPVQVDAQGPATVTCRHKTV